MPSPNDRFSEGIPCDIGSPEWSTLKENEHYPEQGFQVPDSSKKPISLIALPPEPLRLGRSILRQIVHTEISADYRGRQILKVILNNQYADGRNEVKQITEDTSKVLEEVEEVRRDMRFLSAPLTTQNRNGNSKEFFRLKEDGQL